MIEVWHRREEQRGECGPGIHGWVWRIRFARAYKCKDRGDRSQWGKPSTPLLIGEIEGLPIVFLSRHEKGHRLSPSDINYRANIDVLKRAGVTDLASLSACGSF
jgi:purine nucleoside phosphorylase